MSIKDETVLAGKKTLEVIPVETKTTVSNAQTGEEYAGENEAKADVDNPATDTTSDDIRRDVAVKVNKLDIFGEVNSYCRARSHLINSRISCHPWAVSAATGTRT